MLHVLHVVIGEDGGEAAGAEARGERVERVGHREREDRDQHERQFGYVGEQRREALSGEDRAEGLRQLGEGFADGLRVGPGGNAERDADAELILTTKKDEGSLLTASKSAEGIKLEGDAKANAEKQMQLASVEAQLKLASEIGNNDGYQHYLIQVRQIEANEKVGLAQADNIKGADIKIIAGAGDVTGGISSAAGALSPKGGFNLAGMLTSLAATDEGKALLEKLGLKTAAKTE